MSPFEFLLNEFKFLVMKCQDYYAKVFSRPTWSEAFEQCKNYREYLNSIDIDPVLKVKSYLLKKEDIEELLNQAQADLDGIRIYIGHEILNGDRAVRLFCIACTKNADGIYNDWNIPAKAMNPTETLLGESRPCPDECGGHDNPLNSDGIF